MKKVSFYLACGVFLCSASYGYEYSDYNWITNPSNGHQYAITLDYSNWVQGEAWASEVGGHLATINDASENAWLSDTFQGYYSKDGYGDHNRSLVWIGYNYSDNQWGWSSGEPVTFDPPWYVGSPAPHGGIHVYLHTATHHAPGTWWEDTPYDTNPESYIRGIIEIPEPATLSLIALGGLALLRKRN